MTAQATIPSPSRAGASRVARAFTLLELLVVISIFIIILAVAVPSFASLLYSQERTQAENQLVVALGAARSTAVATEGLGDTAAVFFFEPGGRTRITICQEVGQIQDMDSAGTIVKRDVFVPAAGVQPLVLPRGWMIRAFAPPGAVDDGVGGGSLGWYEPIPGARQYSTNSGNWVFPETGFYEPDARQNPSTGLNRQSFMVRFEAGTGLLNMSSRTPAIVADPSPSSAFRMGPPWSRVNFKPGLLRADDPAGYVRRLLVKRKDLSDADRRLMLGDYSPDTVLARPVSELALYDERSLAAGIKANGLNLATGSLYGDTTSPALVPTAPTLDPRLFGGSFDALAVTSAINNWIQGNTGKDGPLSDARIFAIDRYQGTLREVTP